MAAIAELIPTIPSEYVVAIVGGNPRIYTNTGMTRIDPPAPSKPIAMPMIDDARREINNSIMTYITTFNSFSIASMSISLGSAPMAILGESFTGTNNREGILLIPNIADNSCCSSVLIL